MIKFSSIQNNKVGFFAGPRLVRHNGGPEKGPESAESGVSMPQYRKRFEEIENSLNYVAKNLPPADLPGHKTPDIRDTLNQVRLEDAAKRALRRLKLHDPSKISSGEAADHLEAINNIYDKYLEEAKGPSGVPISGGKPVEVYDEEENLEERIETAATHAVGRVMEAWLTGIRATIGGVEKIYKKIQIKSLADLEKKVAAELARTSDKELRAAPVDSSWLIQDEGISFIITKEGARKYDVQVLDIDKKHDKRYVGLSRELNQRLA